MENIECENEDLFDDFTKLTRLLIRKLNTTVWVNGLVDTEEEWCVIPLNKNTYIRVDGICGGYDHIGILQVNGCPYDFMNKTELKLFFDELSNSSWECVWKLKYYCEGTTVDTVVDIVIAEVRKIQAILS